jgi:hypothetical protein
VRTLLTLLLAGVLGLAASGCGGGSHGSTAAATTARAHAGGSACRPAAKARALAKIDADLAALRRAAAKPSRNTLAGGPAVNRATDRFLLDVGTAPLSNIVRNRLIDHAAAALVGSCQQCFQALEASRPIPAIAQGDRGACS